MVFFKQFDPVTLNIGDFLRLSATVTGVDAGNAAEQVNFALMNTGVVVDEDVTRSSWSGVRGYNVRINTGTANTARLRANTGGGDLLAGGSQLVSTNISPLRLENEIPQSTNITLEVHRTGTETFHLLVFFNDDEIFNFVDTRTIDYATFDTIAFGLDSASEGRFFDLGEISLVYIPEPSGLLLSLLAIAGLLLRRRPR